MPGQEALQSSEVQIPGDHDSIYATNEFAVQIKLKLLPGRLMTMLIGQNGLLQLCHFVTDCTHSAVQVSAHATQAQLCIHVMRKPDS